NRVGSRGAAPRVRSNYCGRPGEEGELSGAIDVRDTTGLAAALEAVLFTLNRPVTVLELQDILQSPLPDIEAAAAALGESLAGRGLFLPRHQDQLQLVDAPAQSDL